MSTELEDLEQRVELLEGHLHQLELRLNYDDMRHQILSAARLPSPAGDGRDTAPDGSAGHLEVGAQEHELGRLEALLGSILINQGEHAAKLRRALDRLQILVERKP